MGLIGSNKSKSSFKLLGMKNTIFLMNRILRVLAMGFYWFYIPILLVRPFEEKKLLYVSHPLPYFLKFLSDSHRCISGF